MAISPPSDIVLDVARAAEPERLEAARARLANRASGMVPAEAFSVVDPRVRSRAANAAPDVDELKPYRNFEAMVLTTFVQEMMPKQTESVYGQGLSGDMWKSMLAQQLGTVISDRGGIGIANHLLKDHYREGDQKVALSGVSAGSEKERLDGERALSSALVQETQRRLTADIAGDTNPSSTGE